MTDENITDETLTGGEDVAPAGGGEAVDSKQETIEQVLSKELGKNFPDRESALKAVKDTFAYVGKKKEDIAKEVSKPLDTSKFVSKEEFDEALYYSKNPEYEPYKKILTALKKDSGKTLSEVVTSDDFKGVYEKVSAYDKSEKSKSVLHTNPRLGQITDNMDKAREAVSKGDFSSAKTHAVNAVLDAYERS